MCEGEELLKELKKVGGRVLDDEMREYAREIAKDKKRSKEFLIRAGIHDKDGNVIGLNK